ncbi:uncharacterized protein LOC121244122 [Juglans microcarpa x Juglans regia]|uniref:uncharacterized protein LOC121244122 n=1 Tax=Juglans microcarpa x Juglans regia TaxID=2249226 RepID=UPI001B7DBB47|nr:uncharacterized protein LOC121244122 [Juglans microcarpa x Juglans regia]
MALIAAATFQSGLNPPGGVWQDNKNDHGVNQEAGTAILGSYSHNCKVFFFFNTLAFSLSIYVIGYLVYRFPFYVEIWIGLASFSTTYGISTASLHLRGAACLNELLVTVAFLLPLVTLFARYPLKRAWRKLSTHQSTDQ